MGSESSQSSLADAPFAFAFPSTSPCSQPTAQDESAVHIMKVHICPAREAYTA